MAVTRLPVGGAFQIVKLAVVAGPPKEIAEISSSFVKITTDKSTIQYINLDYIQVIIPKNLKVISF